MKTSLFTFYLSLIWKWYSETPIFQQPLFKPSSLQWKHFLFCFTFFSWTFSCFLAFSTIYGSSISSIWRGVSSKNPNCTPLDADDLRMYCLNADWLTKSWGGGRLQSGLQGRPQGQSDFCSLCEICHLDSPSAPSPLPEITQCSDQIMSVSMSNKD